VFITSRSPCIESGLHFKPIFDGASMLKTYSIIYSSATGTWYIHKQFEVNLKCI